MFPTSDALYKRLKTDPNFRPHLAVISYEDSMKKKMCDIQLTKFIPVDKGGDIPMHRIYYFKYDGEIIWDRKNKICSIDHIRFQQQQSDLIDDKFILLTFNVLNDRYLSKNNTKINTSQRLDTICQYLLNCNADIICLQEVSPDFLTRLTSTEFKHKYPYLASTTLDDDNIVFLTKYTIYNSNTIIFNNHKQSLIITLHDQLYNQPINLIGIHLTSHRQSNSESKRLEQLRCLNQYVTTNQLQNIILVGDFNSDQLSETLTYINTTTEPTLTYNPVTNPYAKIMSMSNLPQSLDKILYQSQLLRPIQTCVNSQIKCSDHYPLETTFEIYNQIIPTEIGDIDQSTALCIILPTQFWTEINDIRQKYDLGFSKWMPHITLAHGFLPLSNLHEFLNQSHQIPIASFQAHFTGVDLFTHQTSETHYITPTTETLHQLIAIYNYFKLQLPAIFSTTYNPHITLGSHKTKNTFNLQWPITKLHIIAKTNGSNYYRVIHQIQLKNQTERPQTDQILQILSNFNPKINWKIGGSGVFQFDDSTQNDLDLIAFGQVDKHLFMTELTQYLDTCGEFYLTTTITNPHLTYLKTNYNLVMPVDIHYIQQGTDILSNQSSLTVLNESLTHLQSVPNSDLFKQGLNQIKRLAKSSQIYGATTGFLPGIAWSIMCAHLCQQFPNLTIDTFIQQFCQYYSNFNYTQPIALKGTTNFYKKSTENFADKLMLITTCTPPYVNVVRNLTPSTKAIILQEFQTQFNQQTLQTPHCLTLMVTAHQSDYKEFFNCLSLINENMIKLIIRIDQLLGFVRPFAITQTQVTNQHQMTWTIGYQPDSNVVEHYVTRLITKLQQQFTQITINYRHN